MFYNGRFRLGKRVKIAVGFWTNDNIFISPKQECIIQKVNSEAIMPITYNVDINSSLYTQADRVYNVPEYILEEI